MSPFFLRRPEVHFPRFLYDLALDCFAIVQCWEPFALSGPERGRFLEKLFCRYCDSKRLRLTEVPGSRTLCGQQSASGFAHESDAVIAMPDLIIHVEMKYLSSQLGKNEMLVFNQKGLDFLAAANRTIRKRPLYRLLFSGYPLSEEARRFALQWGIIVIEPERMPLLVLHRFAGLRIPCLVSPAEEMQDQIWEEIPRIVVPLQERMQRLVLLLQDDEPLVSTLRLERILETYQLLCGDAYWAALDEATPGWLEDAYDALRLEDL
jgi:hypothetical protein